VLVDGSASGRFCDSPVIIAAIDTNKDKILQREELRDFYAGGSQEDMRSLVTLHVLGVDVGAELGRRAGSAEGLQEAEAQAS